MNAFPSLPLTVLALAAALAACGNRTNAPSAAGGNGAAPAGAEGGTAALANGDFEAGSLAPWTTLVHADPTALTVDLVADAARQGDAVLRLSATGSEPWGGVEQTIAAAPLHGRQVELSAWVRGESLTGGPALLAVFEGGPWTQPVDLEIEGLGADFDWQRISTRFDVPATAEGLRIGVLIRGGGVLRVDAVELTPVP
jgi:hypothetical protein